jgi:hypothetical protein
MRSGVYREFVVANKSFIVEDLDEGFQSIEVEMRYCQATSGPQL